jgi:hypothetical protein
VADFGKCPVPFGQSTKVARVFHRQNTSAKVLSRIPLSEA